MIMEMKSTTKRSMKVSIKTASTRMANIIMKISKDNLKKTNIITNLIQNILIIIIWWTQILSERNTLKKLLTIFTKTRRFMKNLINLWGTKGLIQLIWASIGIGIIIEACMLQLILNKERQLWFCLEIIFLQ